MGTIAEKLQAIVNSKNAIKTAIQNKGQTITDTTPLSQYASFIDKIEAKTGQTKTVTPTKSTQVVTPTNSSYELTRVTVNPIPSNYIVPSGTKSITENGTYSVTSYANVNVNISTSISYNPYNDYY